VTEDVRFDDFLDGFSAAVATKAEKIFSAAARVGSACLGGPGVFVRERDRRVLLPKEPVSATVRRGRVVEGFSTLGEEKTSNWISSIVDLKGGAYPGNSIA
jgi:hypothetical protein